jgi:hypothetical protein
MVPGQPFNELKPNSGRPAMELGRGAAKKRNEKLLTPTSFTPIVLSYLTNAKDNRTPVIPP